MKMNIEDLLVALQKKIIREDHHNYLFDKREISYDKRSACKKRWETFA